MLLGAGVNAKKTYLDDVFSTFLYEGNGSDNRVVTNNIDLANEGGLVWVKNRDNTTAHYLTDTVRGVSKGLRSNNANAETTSTVDALKSFTSTGFTVGTGGNVNENNVDLASWTFRKAPGFFDVVTYTGNGSNRTISHSLGSIPGMIIIKRTDTTSNWSVYHRDFNGGVNPEHYVAFLDSTDAKASHATSWNNSPPTSSVFHVGTHARVNGDGGTFVAYLFAGGESGAATARSIDLDGSGDYLSTSSSSSDFTMGTGDFTIECWAKPDANSSDQPLFQISDTSGGFKSAAYTNTLTVWHRPGGNWVFCANGSEQEISGYKPPIGVWYHMALVRNSGTTTLYVNGRKINSATDSTNYNGTYFVIGGYYSTAYVFNGLISNFRVVKGTAVYTSAFNPPTAPLTNITNTKLLCCNNSSTTGSTVSPVTINAYGNTTASSDSPFDDPAGFKFGESGSENVIKCGSYIGNGSSTGPEINLGFEPQFIFHKSSSVDGTAWHVFDCMRGVVAGGNDAILVPNTNAAEASDSIIDITSTGFKITTSAGGLNQNNGRYVYMAIRRSDGYVGKPPELGNQVFTPVYGSANAPLFKANNHVVDFTLQKNSNFATQTTDWNVTSRLTSGKLLQTNTSAAETSNTYQVFDYQSGTSSFTGGSGIRFGWLWKRYAGFDVIAYEGNGVAGRQISHSMNKTVEMVWIKKRSETGNWIVGHKGMNGGTNPWQYSMQLDSTDASTDNEWAFDDTAPTSTAITLGTDGNCNGSGKDYLMMLFASVEGISKVGYYTGNNTTQTITTGFQPRFVIIKKVSSADNWLTFDTVRGWTSGATDKELRLNASNAQADFQVGYPTSTGFYLDTDDGGINQNDEEYIYYAHA